MPSLPDDVYWAGRQREYLEQLAKDEADLAQRLSKVYASEAAKLDRMIAAYYQQYGENNVIEYRRLLASISDSDRTLLMERMDDFAAKYPQYAHLMPVRASIYRLNELEAIQWQIRLQQYEIGAIEQEELDAHFRRQARRAANDAAEAMGFGKEFYSYDSEVVRETVGQAWASGKDFSERIWDNRERLAEYLNDDFSKAIARGVAYEVISKELRDRLEHNGSKTAMRLVYTEGTFLFNEAHARVFEQDFQYYQLSCVHDGRACETCLGLEKYQQDHPAIYDERKPGTNFPPMHPWCRCTTMPYVEDWQAWIDSYVARHGGDSATPPIAQEHMTSSAGSLLDGVITAVKTARKTFYTYSLFSARQRRQIAKSERREHRVLSEHGLEFVPIPTDKQAPASIDLWMNHGFWELKSVSGDVRRVAQRIDNAVRKWDKLHEAGMALGSTPKVIIDNIDGKSSDEDVAEVILDKMREYDDKGFSEAYLIGHDGRLWHITPRQG